MPNITSTPVCRLCGRYLAILGKPIRITVPAVTVAPTALVGSLIRSSNLPHSLQRGVPHNHPQLSPFVTESASIRPVGKTGAIQATDCGRRGDGTGSGGGGTVSCRRPGHTGWGGAPRALRRALGV